MTSDKLKFLFNLSLVTFILSLLYYAFQTSLRIPAAGRPARRHRGARPRVSTRARRTRCCSASPAAGKTFTVATVIERTQRPTLVIAHNKTLAAQLYQEFKTFFPENSVEYFVSYYDYYQPEAYVPASDTYIEKEATINEEIDRLRLSATRALFERRDVIVVALGLVHLRPRRPGRLLRHAPLRRAGA